MKTRSIANAILQIIFAGLRYLILGWVYAHSELDTVGQINVLLTFVTAITFLAGFEFHNVANRPLMLGQKSELQWGFNRIATSLITIGLMSSLAEALVFGRAISFAFAIQVFIASAAEYLALEMGRILTATGHYITVTICGFIRSIAPFVVFVTTTKSLEAMLLSWSIGAFVVDVILFLVLRRLEGFNIKWRKVEQLDYHSAMMFFASGLVMAFLPTIERWLIGALFSTLILGQYALSMTLVSACDLVFQGGVWQPYLKKILQRLAEPSLSNDTVKKLSLGILLSYTLACLLAVLFSKHLMQIINKSPLPKDLLIGVFMLGAAKALYTLIFHCAYVTKGERILPKIQMIMVSSLGVGLLIGSRSALDPGYTLLVVGITWISCLIYYVRSWMLATKDVYKKICN